MQEVSIMEVVEELEYLDMIVQESLRLFPPAPLWVTTTTKS